MVWTVLAVLGMLCLVAGFGLAFGAAAALVVAGVALLAVAIDGRS